MLKSGKRNAYSWDKADVGISLRYIMNRLLRTQLSISKKKTGFSASTAMFAVVQLGLDPIAKPVNFPRPVQ